MLRSKQKSSGIRRYFFFWKLIIAKYSRMFLALLVEFQCTTTHAGEKRKRCCPMEIKQKKTVWQMNQSACDTLQWTRTMKSIFFLRGDLLYFFSSHCLMFVYERFFALAFSFSDFVRYSSLKILSARRISNSNNSRKKCLVHPADRPSTFFLCTASTSKKKESKWNLKQTNKKRALWIFLPVKEKCKSMQISWKHFEIMLCV